MPLPAFLRRRPALALLLLGLLLGLAFQGARGLWEPDEGRYTNVALQMLHSGDWISLRRNETALHFTKPPVTYWSIAASVSAFGRSEWAVRLPLALAYALTVLMVFQLGKRFVPEKPWWPALVYACSPIPLFAANWVSTDTMLVATETLAVLCYVQHRFGVGSLRWMDAMWAGFGLAFLTKGPPALLPLLAIVGFEISQRGLGRLWRPLGLLVFVLVGLGWFAVVVQRHPGLLDYFLGHEVYARIATDEHRRNPEWYGPFVVYGPILLLGLLPWLFRLGWPRLPQWKAAAPDVRFLWLWFALPLLVFCLSRSRMWLYILPLFVPLALLVARALAARPWPPRRAWFIAAWLLVLLAVKFYASAVFVTDKDGRAFAQKLAPLLPGHPDRLMFVEDMTRNGLNLYLDTSIERLSFKPQPKMISDSSYDATLAEALAAPGRHRVFVMKREVERYFLDAVDASGREPLRLGAIADAQGRGERERVVYTLVGEFDPR